MFTKKNLIMNRKIICLLALLLAMGQSGCKKFLNVKPLDRLSGNAFFQDKNDIEDNLSDTYGLLRDKLGSCPFLPNAGDVRSGMMAESPEERDAITCIMFRRTTWQLSSAGEATTACTTGRSLPCGRASTK